MKREDGTTERPVSELIDTLWNVNNIGTIGRLL